jgi:LmbE family N-acetylglucosaminyl deacetylase
MSNQDNTYIDISEVIEQKGRGLQCHISQFGPEEDMLKGIKEWGAGTAKEAKEKKGLEMEYAEAFRRIKLYVPKHEEEV